LLLRKHYLSSNWSFRNRKAKRAILSTDHRIALIAELVEIRVFCPNVLHNSNWSTRLAATQEVGRERLQRSKKQKLFYTGVRRPLMLYLRDVR
jgi:hypothetical protein